MKFRRKEKDGQGRDILVCESRILFWKMEKKFLATEERPKGYWRWVSVPDHQLVRDQLSFQLDAWNREY